MTDSQLVAAFFAQVAFILLVCRAVGVRRRKRVGQPQVMAEMVAGFLLGPSLFGWLAPALQARVFPCSLARTRCTWSSQIGLVLYMFCVGLEFKADLILTRRRGGVGLNRRHRRPVRLRRRHSRCS